MRELVVLGTASQVPTRTRNHNGYFLRWDDEGFMFDPGEGTQRQMLFGGVSAHDITHICITHFHGDHCLGLPGVIQRIGLDEVPHEVTIHFPVEGRAFAERLRYATPFDDRGNLRLAPCGPGPVVVNERFTLTAVRLDHGMPVLGWRIDEPAGRRMMPERLEAAGVRGPLIGRLQREGSVEVDGRTVRLDDMSEHRPGQSFAFVMDTRPCVGAATLAAGADLVVCEATFAAADADLAERYGHMTTVDAARLAAEAGARRLAITHFSQRYQDVAPLLEEARAIFPDTIALADLDRIPLPREE